MPTQLSVKKLRWISGDSIMLMHKVRPRMPSERQLCARMAAGAANEEQRIGLVLQSRGRGPTSQAFPSCELRIKESTAPCPAAGASLARSGTCRFTVLRAPCCLSLFGTPTTALGTFSEVDRCPADRLAMLQERSHAPCRRPENEKGEKGKR